MKIVRFSIMVLTLLICLTACKNTDNVSNTANQQNQQSLLSYSEYIDIVKLAKEKLNFTTIPMKLSASTLENPYVVIVNDEMSFGKKKYLSLENENTDPTQIFLTFEDAEKGYKLITGWIFTNVSQGENLLYFKPNIEGNTGDFNSILSYKNILIHLQLINTASTNPSSEDFVAENEAVLKDIVSFLEKY
jgi:hypothetical protein